jgi:hypothetical protein
VGEHDVVDRFGFASRRSEKIERRLLMGEGVASRSWPEHRFVVLVRRARGSFTVDVGSADDTRLFVNVSRLTAFEGMHDPPEGPDQGQFGPVQIAQVGDQNARSPATRKPDGPEVEAS